MITPKAECFYVVTVDGEAADFVAGTISLSTMSDISQIVLISEDFKEDIEAINSLDTTLNTVKEHLCSDVTETHQLNPLYIPSTTEEVASLIEDDEATDNFRFVGMDGSPFTVKTVEVSSTDGEIMLGKVAFKPFEMPTYNEIIDSFANQKLN